MSTDVRNKRVEGACDMSRAASDTPPQSHKGGGGAATGPGAQAGSAAPAAAVLTHLQRLEAESIHILREVVAECERPVMLYSVGKDSAVMLHLAVKAFYPAPPPFPLLHVDTTWKFRAMYEFRDRMVRQLGMRLLVHVNPEGLRLGLSPFTHGSQLYTDVMKTQALKQALDEHRFDAAFGGEADTPAAIIRETLLARSSERQGRLIDHDAVASMEKKKQEGYF